MNNCQDRKSFILEKYDYLPEGQSVFSKTCYCGKPQGRCSLGVKRKGGVLLFNCFSVSCPLGSGRASSDAFYWSEAMTTPEEPKELTNELPEGFVRDLPEIALEWLSGYGITQEEAEGYDIGYWATQDRVLIPIYMQGRLVSWQARSLTGAQPKWLTPKGGTGDAVFCSQAARGAVGVLVEDTISCIRVGKLYPAIASLGTHVSAEKSRNIYDWYREKELDKLVILLDDDAYGKAMTKILPALSRHNMRVKVVKGGLGKDPKAMTEEELKGLIS